MRRLVQTYIDPERRNLSMLETHVTDNEVTMVTGCHGIGKSTLLASFAHARKAEASVTSQETVLYVSLCATSERFAQSPLLAQPACCLGCSSVLYTILDGMYTIAKLTGRRLLRCSQLPLLWLLGPFPPARHFPPPRDMLVVERGRASARVGQRE